MGDKKRRLVGKFTGNTSLTCIDHTINKEQLLYFIINSEQQLYTKEDIYNIIKKLEEFETDKLDNSEFNYLS